VIGAIGTVIGAIGTIAAIPIPPIAADAGPGRGQGGRTRAATSIAWCATICADEAPTSTS
jgi:hypothetical protein